MSTHRVNCDFAIYAVQWQKSLRILVTLAQTFIEGEQSG